jgi:hypothetical protein
MTLPVVTHVGAAARIIGSEAAHAVLHAAATTAALLVVAGFDFVRGGRIIRTTAIIVRVAAAVIVRGRQRAADDRAGGETAAEAPAPASAAPAPSHSLDVLVAAFLIASAPPTGAAEAIVANDGTATAINAAAIRFVIVFDIVTPLN